MTDHGVPSTTPKNGGSLLNGASTPSSMAAATAACRKLGPPGTPAVQKFTQAQIKAWVTYAACMRKHGVPNYPDPKFLDNDTHLILGQGVDYHSPLVQDALTACKHLYLRR